jgi:DNA-binding NarL/FixJ family response regulator
LPVLRAALKAAASHHYEFGGFFDKPPFEGIPEPADPKDIWLIDLQMLRSVLLSYPENYGCISRSGFVVVAARQSDLSRLREFEKQIDGVVIVERLTEQLSDAILLATSKHSMLPLGALHTHRDAPEQWESDLTPDQQLVLRLLAQGMTNKEIAAATNLPSEAVKALIRRLLARLGFRNRTEAAVSVARSGLGATEK